MEKENKLKIRNNILAIFAFSTLYWVSIYFLVRYFYFSSGMAVLGASLAMLPIVYHFVPEFRELLKSIKSIKISNLELSFSREIDETLREKTLLDIISFSDDPDRATIDKTILPKFIALIKPKIIRPYERMVLSVKVDDEGTVSLPMLYFQIFVLTKYVDLRAVLFIDPRENIDIRKNILGTLSPKRILKILSRTIKGLECSEYNLEKKFESIIGENYTLDIIIHSLWEEFCSMLGDNIQSNSWRLKDELFYNIFAKEVERNLLQYPPKDLYGLQILIDSKAEFVILHRDNRVLSVRTIDHIAREIATKAIKYVTQGTNNKKRKKRTNMNPNPF